MFSRNYHQSSYSFISKYFLILLGTCLFIQCSKDDSYTDKLDKDINLNEIIDFDTATDLVELDEFDDNKKSRESRSLKTINAALSCSGLKDVLFSGNKTIFAPTDKAFRKIGLNASNICDELDEETLKTILSYHVVDRHVDRTERGCIEMIDGSQAYLSTEKRFKMAINNNQISTIFSQRKPHYNLKIFMTNGVLDAPEGDIVEVVSSDDELSYLTELVSAFPDIADALSNSSSFLTVFAPTDGALRELMLKTGSQNINALIENLGYDVVMQTLTYHVIDDCVFSPALSSGNEFSTLQGGTVRFNRAQNGVIDEAGEVNRFQRDGQDIVASNGVIHKIRTVLNPSLDISEAGLNVRKTSDNVSNVKEAIIGTFSGIDAIGVAAEISHSTNALNANLDLNDTELILFGNPRLGTPIMQANQQAGIDLPQKYLIYQDDNELTRIAYNDISYLKARHSLSDDIPTLAIMTNALNNFASSVSDRMAGPITKLPDAGEGLVDKISNRSFDDSYNTIVNAIINNPNLKLIKELDHQANAARVQLELRPTRLIVFGNPNLGTPLMQNSQTVAIDLPQKILVWEDENQVVHITHNDPFYLQSRHGISSNENILNTVSGALNNLTNLGAGI